jgi:hypothetical protein
MNLKPQVVTPMRDARRKEAPRVGDKVRIKSGLRTGSRGVLSALRGHRVTVTLTDGTRIAVSVLDLTNYSAAARLAWERMPKRAGRPPQARRKIRVRVRIDAAVWKELGRLAAQGRIKSRENLVNTLLADTVRGHKAVDGRFAVSEPRLALVPGSRRPTENS